MSIDEVRTVEDAIKITFHFEYKFYILLFLLFVLIFFAGCNNSNSTDALPLRDNTPIVLSITPSGIDTLAKDNARIDYSNVTEGYIMAQYSGSNPKVKLQISKDETTYTYDLSTKGNWEGFPLSLGEGDYTATIFENVSDDQYTQILNLNFLAQIKDEFQPYIRPSQYVNYTSSTNAVGLSEELSSGAKTDLDVVEKIYNYAIKNIDYDYPKAESVQSGYLPDIDATIESGTGICFDYASLMTAMLRAQGIPCKLIVGYATDTYHSWISVYTKEYGWVDQIIEFDGKKWTLMDPTFAATGDESDPNNPKDGKKYNPIYYY